MIELRNLTKVFTMGGKRKVICDNVSLCVPSRVSVALLGRNGAGKSTLLRMLAGNMEPTSGEILTDGTISWPVGFAGSFHADLTGAQNVRFVARIYGADTDDTVRFVEDFARLGDHFYLPIRSYSSGMKARLAFGVSMAIPFDTYLVDEVTATGDASFRENSRMLFKDRMRGAGAFFVTHSMPQVREFCDVGLVLENGQATFYEDLEEAIAVHERNMQEG
jgi:capsular polysaccharide transport system ATP-binding protein